MRLFNIVWKLVLISVLIIGIESIPITVKANSDTEHASGGNTPEEKQMNQDKVFRDSEISRHFHNNESELVNPIPQPEGASTAKSFCIDCHGSLPHKKSRVVRAMFNFHKIFIACETCHYKERLNKEKVGYRWYDGTERTIADLLKLESKSLNRPTGPQKKLTEKDIYEKYGFKISPYIKENGRFVMMVSLTDDPYPQEYLKMRNKLTPDQQAGIKAKIHGNIDGVGSDCIDCHKSDSQLPYKALGFTSARVKDLVQTEAAGLFKYYSRDPKYKNMTFRIRKLGQIWFNNK
ncbi:hypothetical protein HY745_02710 [Candidatus Desantisbacteria bacterium]|nr:hypothetical protein [Candidatus Desantisbacteria bacterium]